MLLVLRTIKFAKSTSSPDMAETFWKAPESRASLFVIQTHPSVQRPEQPRLSSAPWTLHWLPDHISAQTSANSLAFWRCHVAFASRLKLWPNSHFLAGNYLTVAKQHYSDSTCQLHLLRSPKEASSLQSESHLRRNELWRAKNRTGLRKAFL